ncbi:MAG: hypothetical protein A2005_00915 [Desulfuromonadales bacterium GWC2_61_20]|nr:MAG: hypothetical protein A2005_00915 [Desulfuromonadales bacterium GWC2_61_20]HAD04956.1 hypothetical protein [Desulfuromonas sp.]HBT84240.1 hypothetical protein [Desulfuromonas sp.]
MKRPDSQQLREAWLLFFILGIVMLNFPFLEIFNKTSTILGIPVLFLYFFVGWPSSILVIFLFCYWIEREDSGSGDGGGPT